ncbi:MAG: right-handed parallel beta-helix repeat-containing protein [Massilia sp.]
MKSIPLKASAASLVVATLLAACGGGNVDSGSAGQQTTLLANTGTGATYYVSPTGSDSAAGTLAAPWRTIARAQTAATAGDTVYFRGGTYTYSAGINTCASQTDTVNAITLDKSGVAGGVIRYWAYGTEVPIFDFSSMTDDCRVKGFNVTGSYLHLRGLEITGAPQHNNLNHESWGVWITGSNNTFERLNTHHHMGPGLFIQNGSYNLVLNTDSHHNYDPLTSNGAGQSADGFGAHIKANNPGNVFRGCRAWSNSDDGFDLINAFSSVTIENSWAWLSGYLPGTTTSVPAGNGNGIKAGGYGGVYVSNGVKHFIRFSVAFRNKAAGFYANHHTVANDWVSNTAYNNGANFDMLSIDSTGAAVNMGNLRNNLAYINVSTGVLTRNISGASQVTNSWQLPVTITDADFVNYSMSGWDAPRQSDGSLPILNQMKLVTGSDLIDKGTNVGFGYNGAAPDLGAFEK